jgi:LacI family transcriptional regulator
VTSSWDVAKLAGVSRSQVSNYFNRPDLVSALTNHRISEAVAQLGYVPNEAARRLRRGQSENIGVVLLDAWAPFFDQVSIGIEDEADAHGWSVQFSNSRRSLERERRHIEYYGAQMAQGVIVFPGGDVSIQVLGLARRGIAVVLLDPPHATRRVSPVPSVAVDHVEGGRLAAQHLLERGSRRPAFVGNPESVEHVADRFEGFAQAIHEAGLRSRPAVYVTDSLTVHAGSEAAQQLVGLSARRRPDALFAGNDLVALGILQALTSAGVSVPGDVKIIGYDDVDLVAQIGTPLSTIRQPAALLGASAVRLVVGRCSSAEGETEDSHLILRPELVVRSTT